MAGHGRKARVDRTLLADANAIDRGANIVVDATPPHATDDRERMAMRTEQHFVRLQQLGSNDERGCGTV